MLFNSLHFLAFFPIVVAAYFSMAPRQRWWMLLLASCYFYMVFIPKYILILFALILIDYAAGIWIEDSAGPDRKAWLVASLVANIGMLGFFKYFNFVSGNLAALFSFAGWRYPIPTLQVALPIGLSFHTFQSMSYTIEVYRGNQKAERHLGIYALYVLFFPQMVAGPIERPQHMLHQFYEEHAFEYQRVVDGLKLMAWGFFKKIVIADRLTLLVDAVYGRPSAHNGTELLIATYFFAFQIYCDFSGYSDIAIGAAQVMGLRLMDNFNRPYFSKSIAEFWKRWHISLSTWFKDYLYIPLGGNRTSEARWYFNLLFVFLVSGLWHGANWTFLLWGAMHGTYLIVSIWTRSLRGRVSSFFGLERSPALRDLVRVFITFHLVTFAWVAFRAKSISETAVILGRIFNLFDWALPRDLGMGANDLAISIAAVAFMECVHLLQRHRRMRQMVTAKPFAVRWAIYATLLLMIVCFGEFNSQSFIYFQF